MQEKTKSILLMLLCAMLWSIGGVFIKLIPWNSFAIAGARSLIAAMVIFAYLRLKHIRLLWNRRTAAVMLGLTGTFFCFVCATKLTTAANAIVIQYTGPLFLLLYSSLFLHQKLRLADCLVVAATILGISVFFFDKIGGGTTVGNLIALLSGVFFASMFVTTGNASDEERINGLLQGQLLTALLGLPSLFLTPSPISIGTIGCILALGVFQLGLAYILYSVAMHACPPLACSILASLEPLLNPVWVAIFYGEAPGPLSLVGGILVIASVTVWCVYDGKHPRLDAQQALK